MKRGDFKIETYETIINALRKLDFTEYESRIYLALLKQSPLNGNMIANLSGVPGAKVYSCLKKMVEKEFISIVYGEGKSNTRVMYTPVPYRKIIDRYSTDFLENLTLLKTELKNVQNHPINNLVVKELYQITDYEIAIDTVRKFIQKSKTSIYLCGWNEIVSILYEDLKEAQLRNVKIVSLMFDEPSESFDWKNSIHFDLDIVRERHKREFNIVVDEEKVGNCQFDQTNTYAVFTSNLAVVHTTLNYIRHDIYINRLIDDLNEEAINKYGKDLRKLLDI